MDEDADMSTNVDLDQSEEIDCAEISADVTQGWSAIVCLHTAQI